MSSAKCLVLDVFIRLVDITAADSFPLYFAIRFSNIRL